MIDWTINIGIIIQTTAFIIALIAGWNALKTKLSLLEQTLNNHASSLIHLAKRIDKHEERNIELVGDVQRLIGIVELGRRESI